VNHLPDFLILGTQKGGTTSLHHFLAGHPEVTTAAQKEVHFFDLNHHLGLDWYRAQFPEVPPGRITGEATPYYLFHPLAAERACRVVPDARLIVLLRDPAERAWSHYHHVVRQGEEPLSFEEALAREEERLAGEADRIRRDGSYYSFAHRKYSYRSRGLYADQLSAWRAHFPLEQFLLLRSEDLFDAPAETWRRVTDFLGLSPSELPAQRRHNSYPHPPLSGPIRQRLAEYFAPHNLRLRDEWGLTLHEEAR